MEKKPPYVSSLLDPIFIQRKSWILSPGTCRNTMGMAPSGYDSLTVRHGKIRHAIKNGVYHLFRLGPSLNTMANC